MESTSMKAATAMSASVNAAIASAATNPTASASTRRIQTRTERACLIPCISASLLAGGMCAADGRRHDLVGDVEVPHRGAAACGELRDELRQSVQALERPP